MILDFATLVPEPGTVDPSDLATALQALAALAGVRGTTPPTIASASTCSIFATTGDDVGHLLVSGTTGITAFGANNAGERRIVEFTDVLTVNYSSAIDCPGEANYVTEAGTMALVVGLGSGNVKLRHISHPSQLAGVTQALPPGFLFGLTLANNAADANNDIDVAVGRARNDADGANLVLASALTKRLDANWTAGTNQGGLDTGSKANSTTYHVFLIAQAGGANVDVLFSATLASPTMPGGYTVKRRIGSIMTDGSGNIRPFKQVGDEFQLVTPVLDVNVASMTTARELRALTVPGGLSVAAMLRAYSPVAGGQVIILSDPLEADTAPSLSAAPMMTLNGAGQAFHGVVRTDSNRQIATRSNTAGTILRAATFGWIDRRGRDA